MATISMQQPRRRKQATYGKTARSVNSWNFTDLDSLDDELAAPTVPISRNSQSQRPASSQKAEAKPSKLKSVKRKAEPKKKDAWDVSSTESSDVDELSPVKARSPPRFAKKVKAPTFQEPKVELAPWEKKKTSVTKTASRVDSTNTNNDGMRLDVKDSNTSESGLALVANPTSATKKLFERNVESITSDTPSPRVMSAAERLKAKRLQSGSSGQSSRTENVKPASRLQKRAGPDNGRSASPRKRTRSDKQNADVQDTVMADVTEAPDCSTPEPAEREEKPAKQDDFDFPDSSANEATRNDSIPSKRIPAQQSKRRGKLTTYSSPRKMESAPARLSEMLPIDTDTTDTAQSPPEMMSRPATPQIIVDAGSTSSPKTAFKVSAGMTPKQAQAWSRLFPSDTAVASSPSVLPMKDLNIGSTRRSSKPTTAASRMMPKSSSDVGRQQPRLVDRLKASARSSSSEGSSDEYEDDQQSDVEMADGNIEQVSQSQTQVATQTTGPRITYARVRSYLPEDSFEDGLMMEMPSQTPQRPSAPERRASGKAAANSQNSAFDVEDSEDEGASGRLRTIHELRAGGGHQRFMDDIGSLMDDIADHNHSARGRRRSAMVEIATKLVEKGVVERFFRQGFEQRLLAECGTAPDDVADYALATSFAVMLAGGSPEHASQTFRDGGGLPWLVRLLDGRTDPRKLARERRNNMSKAAISTFSDFVTNLAKNEVLWADDLPTLITSRAIALKALDLLIGKLRRSGDRSEILSSHDLEEVVFSQAELDTLSAATPRTDLLLSVSILESLSTSTISLSWPSSVITRLTALLSIPPPPDSAPQRQHVSFLTLRLCLNLTNDNARNVRLFSSNPTTTHALLTSISTGFTHLAATAPLPPSSPSLTFSSDIDLTATSIPDPTPEANLPLDLLVLAMGISINLTTSSTPARLHSLRPESRPLLDDLVSTFRRNHAATNNASSLASGFSNVAFGYLSVVLANFCLDPQVRAVVAGGLKAGKLGGLVDAVEEFVRYHQRVDGMSALTQGVGEEEEEEGGVGDVWGVFTERLRGVATGLRRGAEGDGLL
ncbi:hypothetical protein TI39_contig371g00009 [Zymoseptoria brevis]|uniref:Wings apart-like protein C-terminal domain-containing protein n=1 Tax=Zymoseptoria brevis TaxID=1047168 RepID=A0A0F4GQ29_9PEZI|nr:hypothetical protein TI39_contig371g00009 [Zymoseptoria brevis]